MIVASWRQGLAGIDAVTAPTVRWKSRSGIDDVRGMRCVLLCAPCRGLQRRPEDGQRLLYDSHVPQCVRQPASRHLITASPGTTPRRESGVNDALRACEMLVLNASLTGPPVESALLGHNLEFTRHDLFAGLSAELLANRKFVGLAPCSSSPTPAPRMRSMTV